MALHNRSGVFVALAPALALVALAAPGHAGHVHDPLPCPRRGQAVIAADRTMRVYRPKLTARNESEQPVVACVAGTSTRMRLPGAPGVQWAGLAIAGDVAAYVTSTLTGVDTSVSQLTVADVAHRVILRTLPVGRGVDAGFLFSEGPSALAVTPHGALAWIVSTSGPLAGHAAATRVLAAARVGPVTVLDEGPAIEPASLYLSGETVNWVDDGTTRSAPLPTAVPAG